jgi:hypothetical protein
MRFPHLNYYHLSANAALIFFLPESQQQSRLTVNPLYLTLPSVKCNLFFCLSPDRNLTNEGSNSSYRTLC